MLRNIREAVGGQVGADLDVLVVGSEMLGDGGSGFSLVECALCVLEPDREGLYGAQPQDVLE